MSLPSVSPVMAARASFSDVDIEILINAIGVRPALWNKHKPEYSDRILKTRMWEEVYDIVIDNWGDLTSSEKKTIGAEVQKKWKHLKDNFHREVAAQNKTASGQESKKRRPYIHFQALSFLASLPLERDTTTNIAYEDTTEEIEITERGNKKKSHKLTKNTNQQIDDQILEILREKRVYDEDISFTEMLVPMLKKLNEDQKHFAKIEILNILNHAKSYKCSTKMNSFHMSGRSPSISSAPRGIPLRQVRSAMSQYDFSSSPSPSRSSVQDNDAPYEASHVYSPTQTGYLSPTHSQSDNDGQNSPQTVTPRFDTFQPSEGSTSTTDRRNLTSQPNPLTSPHLVDVQYVMPQIINAQYLNTTQQTEHQMILNQSNQLRLMTSSLDDNNYHASTPLPTQPDNLQKFLVFHPK